jgi:FlaA1/EpsC-like NDP-sugar epimerase
VEVEDLLGREPVKVNLEEMAGYLAGRVALVTGAGGSIGSELCRQIARFGPKKLVLLGHGENSIYNIHQELSARYPELDLVPAIVDVRDAPAVRRVFKVHQPGAVFHAAAHKHVPLMEENALEAVKNNVLGTLYVARAAREYNAHTFVLISTDKAVNPVSIMGATKRVAEMIVQEMAAQGKTRFVAVRFGNVLGSRGSVLPLFKKQIAGGGPVTVTHPEMTRYFMTIPEAVQLVIQAGAMARGGEIFVLDMGEPVKIVELAETMIRLSGFEPGEDIEIVYTGLRPGEKLSEELFARTEKVDATRHERIFVARPETVNAGKLDRFLNIISNPAWIPDERELVNALRSVVPEFRRGGVQEMVQVG